MITLGSVSREQASTRFPFLAPRFRGRRAAIKEFTHRAVVYCREDALAAAGPTLTQLVTGLRELPVPLDENALVISDNGDLYGTVSDLFLRETSAS